MLTVWIRREEGVRLIHLVQIAGWKHVRRMYAVSITGGKDVCSLYVRLAGENNVRMIYRA